MRDQSVPEPACWLTTADAARRLGFTPQWVRRLAEQGALPSVLTESGQRIFRRGDVQRYLLQRNDDDVRPRPLVLKSVRLKMVKADLVPLQPHLRLVRPGERSVSDAKVKVARSFDILPGSVKASSVNRKLAGRTR